MRMWMVPPETLCRKHLLGEHGEIHKFLAMCRIAKSDGTSDERRAYKHAETLIRSAMIETRCNKAEIRHLHLALEMIDRGYNHQSPFNAEEWHDNVERIAGDWSVNKYRAEVDLHRRCKECAELFAYWEMNDANHRNLSQGESPS